jgi:hypothetical protein
LGFKLAEFRTAGLFPCSGAPLILPNTQPPIG